MWKSDVKNSQESNGRAELEQTGKQKACLEPNYSLTTQPGSTGAPQLGWTFRIA